MTEGVSTGILEAAHAGRVGAASAMTNMGDWPRAARAWARADPPADLGLHVNLSLGAPLGPMPTFAPGDVLPGIGTILRSPNVSREEIAAEIGRQVDAFRAQAGHWPTHVDGHQHVHALPAIRPALFDALRQRGLSGVSLRDSGDALGRILLRRSAPRKAVGVAFLTRGFARDARRVGFVCNDGFAGFSAFDPAADMRALFASFLRAPGPGHLVMCHPGHIDDALRSLDPVTDAREAELQFLLSPAWPDLMREMGARLRRPTRR